MASAGMDRSIHIWDLNPDQTDDENVIYPHTVGLPLTNHKNSILNLKWGSTESNHLYSCGAINGTSKRGELF
jgi:WD40 repeat protein